MHSQASFLGSRPSAYHGRGFVSFEIGKCSFIILGVDIGVDEVIEVRRLLVVLSAWIDSLERPYFIASSTRNATIFPVNSSTMTGGFVGDTRTVSTKEMGL